MPPRQIVVIGTSAGGTEALRSLVRGLPADFAAPLAVVVHSSPQSPGILHDILSRAGRLTAVRARDREPLVAGRIYVAPPDCHLLIEPGIVRVTKGPKENRFRPAIDPLFRSAAQIFGPAAIGVILTGNLDDGTSGLLTIKQLGGTAIVQDPEEALFPSMPLNALQHVSVDHRVSLGEIPALLHALTSTPAQVASFSVPDVVEVEVEIAKETNALDAASKRSPSRPLTPARNATAYCSG